MAIDDYYDFGAIGYREQQFANQLTDTQLTEVYEIEGNDFHKLQSLLKNLNSYLDMDLKHRTTEDTYALLHFARKTVKNIVTRMENDIVADVLHSDNKDRS